MQILVENMVTRPNILIPFFMVIQIQSQFHVLLKDLMKVLLSILISLEHLSDTSLIFSGPSKSVLTSKISDSSKSFKGPTLLHSKESGNSNR